MRTLLMVALVLSGCAGRTVQTARTVPTLVQAGGATRPVVTLTDVDAVRDVAAGPRHVVVATDRGVLVHPPGDGAEPTRLTAAEGLGNDDVQAVAFRGDGRFVVATPDGIVELSMEGDGLRVGGQLPGDPRVGAVADLAVDADGVLWACGLAGTARLEEEGWVRIGEPAPCLELATGDEGRVWIATTEGARLVEGEVVREHAPGRALPAAYVRAVVALEGSEALALVQGEDGSQLAHFDGDRWLSYTVPELDLPIVGLVRRGDDVLMVTPEHLFAIARGRSDESVPLTVLWRSESHSVRSYGARREPARRVPLPPSSPSLDEVRLEPAPLVEVPVNHDEPEPPSLFIRPMGPLVEKAYLAVSDGDALYLADRNRGVLEVRGGAQRRLASSNLVAERDLQLATDAEGNTWVVTDHGDVARLLSDGLHRVRPPAGVVVDAIATGPQGAYVAARVPGAGATVRVYRVDPTGFTPKVERALELPTDLLGLPFLGVGADEKFWVALRVRREQGEGARTRGIAVLDPDSETVAYHHRAADPEEQGAGSLAMPDEVSSVDTTQQDMVWFASLNGAIRVGHHQAVVFGESRGVRGEVVTDLAVGRDKVWIAAAEGLGYYANDEFEFRRLPEVVKRARPTALAVDSEGTLWGAGSKGVLFNDRQGWHRLRAEDGLPTEKLHDVEVDAKGRVWLLAHDRVLILTR